MSTSNRAALLLATTLLSATMLAVAAQSQITRPQPPQDRQAQPQLDDSTGGQGSSSAPGAGPPGSLSNELSRSQGVVRPPAIGDQGVVSPPSAGAQSTPVIPPPGTPGGKQDVQPK